MRCFLHLLGALILGSVTPVLADMSDEPFPDQAAKEADARMEQSLLGTTWSGTAQDQRLEFHFGAGHSLVYRVDGGPITVTSWGVRAGKILIRVRDARYLEVNFAGAVNGARIVGIRRNLIKVVPTAQAEELPWTMEKLAAPVAELVAAVPPLKPTPPMADVALARSADFEGTYVALVAAEQGRPKERWVLRCQKVLGCVLESPSSPAAPFELVGPLGKSEVLQARFALNYSRERRAKAVAEQPELAPLLDSRAEIVTCIDLRSKGAADLPGLQALCRLDQNPWKEPVVLFMGTILANCGPAFCRYSMLPMFRQR